MGENGKSFLFLLLPGENTEHCAGPLGGSTSVGPMAGGERALGKWFLREGKGETRRAGVRSGSLNDLSGHRRTPRLCGA